MPRRAFPYGSVSKLPGRRLQNGPAILKICDFVMALSIAVGSFDLRTVTRVILRHGRCSQTSSEFPADFSVLVEHCFIISASVASTSSRSPASQRRAGLHIRRCCWPLVGFKCCASPSTGLWSQYACVVGAAMALRGKAGAHALGCTALA